MSDNLSKRYGDLSKLAAKTGGKCHLCHEKIDLDFYGPPGSFGFNTVTVDHLHPQAHGGDDDHENLRLAHASCNTGRGTRDVEEVRLALAGTISEPLSNTERTVVVVCAGGLGYGAGGAVFAKRRSDGTAEFNHGAALITALLTIALVDAVL